MKKTLVALFVFLITFCIGITNYKISTPELTLETISTNSAFYDGKEVEFISYIQISPDFISKYEVQASKDLNVGEVFEKLEARTNLDIKTNSINLDNLLLELSENYSINRHKRAKVRVRGIIIDNCNKGVTCCFGKTMNLIVAKIEQLAPAEDYTLPAK
jgi:hypothetical protein